MAYSAIVQRLLKMTIFVFMVPDSLTVKDVKPVLTGYIISAVMLMKSAPVPDDTAIHDIRVLMKRSRAVMKLLAPFITEETYNREYLIFRDSGRALTDFRESAVHRKTLKLLKKRHPLLFASLSENERINNLLKRTLNGTETVAGTPHGSLTEIIAILNKSAYRIRFLTLHDPGAEALFGELEKSYKIVCSDYIECRNAPRQRRLHQLRKRLKDLLYQLYFFRPFNPAMVKVFERRVEGLAQNLGLYNDLTQLLKEIGYNEPDMPRSPSLDELMIVIRQSQDQCMAKVWPVAYKIFRPGLKLADLIGYRS